MTRLLDLRDEMLARRTFGFLDDFEWYLSPHRWTSLAADAGSSVAVGASATNGTVVLTSGATDNNECASATTNSPFKFADDKPLYFETRLQFTEANVNAANVLAGFASALNSADMLQDNGAGPKASFSGCAIYKVDGETVWRCVSSKGGTQTISVSTKVAGGAAYQTLRIEAQPIDGSSLEVAFFVDGAQLVDSNARPIKHTVAYSSAAAMQAGVYAKAGSANSEIINVDYVGAFQLR